MDMTLYFYLAMKTPFVTLTTDISYLAKVSGKMKLPAKYMKIKIDSLPDYAVKHHEI